jgi:uncharacterized protein YcaQ
MRISREAARRFLLGRQGLWPGRRWKGLRGTEHAMRAMANLQLDPLRIVARAQDLALASRVMDYREDDWARLTYEKRRFFEWGGWLAVRPIDELPFYRVVMRRERTRGRMWPYMEQHRDAIEEMRTLLRERGELSNRDFAIADRARVRSYRGRKDSAIALYYLWRTGDAMVARRDRFERVYAPAEAVAPARYLPEATDAEADDFLLLKGVRSAGFSKLNGAKETLQRDVTSGEIKAWRERKLGDGELVEVDVEGWPGRRVAPGSEASILATLEAGKVPRAWKSLEATTADEVTFLSPLDPAIHDRVRTSALFDFDYKWGVYDKVEKRRFGYYDLPILWDDRLVARMDAKVDRSSSTLVALGLWFEEAGTSSDPAWRRAFERGLARFRTFLGVGALDLRAVDRER